MSQKMRRSSILNSRERPINNIIPSTTGNSNLHIFRENSIASVAGTSLQHQVDDDYKREQQEYLESIEQAKQKERFESEVRRFVEISKYFSNPLLKNASYISENCLVSYPNPYTIEYKRGGITTGNIKFSNLTLEPVFLKLYKLIPEIEQFKYINLSLSRCKRIPPGLSFSLGFVYDDVNEKPAGNAKMVFVASRKTTTPCYQVCEINLQIEPLKIKLTKV